MTPSSELPACKAFPTHIPTTFSPTCHPNLIFSALVAGMLWARCQLDCQLSPLTVSPRPPRFFSAFGMASFRKISWFLADPHLWLRWQRLPGKSPCDGMFPVLEVPGEQGPVFGAHTDFAVRVQGAREPEEQRLNSNLAVLCFHEPQFQGQGGEAEAGNWFPVGLL